MQSLKANSCNVFQKKKNNSASGKPNNDRFSIYSSRKLSYFLHVLKENAASILSACGSVHLVIVPAVMHRREGTKKENVLFQEL